MRVIVAGSRTILSQQLVNQAITDSGFIITELVSGAARGVDKMGELWATMNCVPIKPYHARWSAHGRAAGMMRNIIMADYVDALIAIWDGVSAGTKHMIYIAKKRGLKYFIVNTLLGTVDTNAI